MHYTALRSSCTGTTSAPRHCDGESGDNDAYKRHAHRRGRRRRHLQRRQPVRRWGGLSFCLPNSRPAGGHLHATAARRPLPLGHATADWQALTHALDYGECNYISNAPGAAHACRNNADCASGSCASFPFDTDEVADPATSTAASARRAPASSAATPCQQEWPTLVTARPRHQRPPHLLRRRDGRRLLTCVNDVCDSGTCQPTPTANRATLACASGTTAATASASTRATRTLATPTTPMGTTVCTTTSAVGALRAGPLQAQAHPLPDGLQPWLRRLRQRAVLRDAARLAPTLPQVEQRSWPARRASEQRCLCVGLVLRLDWRGRATLLLCASQRAGRWQQPLLRLHWSGRLPCTPSTFIDGTNGLCEYGQHCESCWHAGIGDSVGGCASGIYCSFISGMSNRCLKNTNARGGAQCFNSATAPPATAPIGGAPASVASATRSTASAATTGPTRTSARASRPRRPATATAPRVTTALRLAVQRAGQIWGCGGGNWCNSGTCTGGASLTQLLAMHDSDPAMFHILP